MKKRKQNGSQIRYYIRPELDNTYWDNLDNSAKDRCLDYLQNQLWNVIRIKLWYHLRTP